ncbi:MFS transporter [Streptomyces himalayensis]|uniref:MFS transporter n=1 Tax=Streptomyces himalayensis subsp. himalayensis TaxID=2756131 RepID=A0A7W0DS07_9ACTN|nr:MFS transporter [Streptomyces himalayensis]MBA2950204.1 MFS transporter [Streptomyces himalayensis subsp. himalayensis]
MNARQHGTADPRHRATLRWIVAIATVTLLFDGYDLVVYGTVVPVLLRDPSQLGPLTPGQAGALGSYALIGVMVGALIAGAIGDHIGRRRVMLVNIAWFSIGMGLSSFATDLTVFGFLRFFTGIGVGALVATVGALIAEFAPPHRRNFYNAVVYSGVPAGGVLAAVLALLASDAVGWRGLFLFGALPLVVLLPLALLRLPESPKWLLARGHTAQALEVSRRTGVPLPGTTPDTASDISGDVTTGSTPARTKVGFPALATRRYALPTLLLGLMSFTGLLLTYGLNTWLPEIMGRGGYGKSYSLVFLLTLNGGAIVGGLIASRAADRIGPQRLVATTFVLAAASLALLTLRLPLGALLPLVAVAGVGTLGTQVLIYGYVSHYYDTVARAAGVAWCAGFGRLGGIGGPVIGGALLGAGLPPMYAFYVFAGVAVIGAVVTVFVPRRSTEPATAPATPAPAPLASGGASVLAHE